MTFDLRQLNAFLAIVSTGSLGRAAETLHVTQPALSRTIRRLEEQVGAPLFERYSKGMQLTAIGSALLPHAVLLQREAEHATEEINAMRRLAKGTIHQRRPRPARAGRRQHPCGRRGCREWNGRAAR